MEGMKDVKSDGSVGDETEKGVVFIDLPLNYASRFVSSKSKTCSPHIYSTKRKQSSSNRNCGRHYV